MYLADHLDMAELRDLIQKGFIRRQNHPTLPLAILNYSNECMFDNFWPDTVQKCRGLIVTTGSNSRDLLPESEIIARPFYKFFGLNQTDRPETHEANLPRTSPLVTEKMDGWFGIMWSYEGQYGIASRGSFTSPGAVFATEKLKKFVKYGAIEEFPKGYSPIFEIIFKEGKIVVDYPFEGIVLLGCVNIGTGEELSYDDLKLIWSNVAQYAADRPWMRLVKAHHMSIDECVTSDKKNFEGFVLSYHRPGTWPLKVKVKLEDYKRLHKLITGVTPQQIWSALHDPMAPWLNELVPDHFRKWAMDWRDILYTNFHDRLNKTIQMVKTVNSKGNITDRRLIKADLDLMDEGLTPAALLLIDNKIYEAHQNIWKSIRPVGRSSDVFYREGARE